MAANPKNTLLSNLKDLVWKTYELEETVANFGPESQAVLDERLLKFIEGVRDTAPLARALEGVTVPEAMLQYVDMGGNPHTYTAEVFRACTRDNQLTKGKVEALRMLESSLMAQMEKDMPQVAQEYRALVAQVQHPAAPRADAQ